MPKKLVASKLYPYKGSRPVGGIHRVHAVPFVSVKQKLVNALDTLKLGGSRAYCPYDPTFTYTGKYYGEQMLHHIAFNSLKAEEKRAGYEFFIKPEDFGRDFHFHGEDIEVKVIDASTGHLYFDFSREQLRRASVFAIYNTQKVPVVFRHRLWSQPFDIAPQTYLLISRKD